MTIQLGEMYMKYGRDGIGGRIPVFVTKTNVGYYDTFSQNIINCKRNTFSDFHLTSDWNKKICWHFMGSDSLSRNDIDKNSNRKVEWIMYHAKIGTFQKCIDLFMKKINKTDISEYRLWCSPDSFIFLNLNDEELADNYEWYGSHHSNCENAVILKREAIVT